MNQNTKQKRSAASWLAELAKGRYGEYALSVLTALLGVACSLVPYFIIIQIITALVNGTAELPRCLTLCGWMAGCWVLRYVLHSVSTSLSHHATFHVLANTRTRLLDKLATLPLGTVLDRSSGSYKNIIVERVDSIETTLAHLLPEMTANIVGALAVLVLLVWSLGYFVSIVWRKGQNPLVLQGKVNLAVSLLVLVILVLLNSPVLDSMRISVNSHMARYQSGKNTPDQVSLYMLEQSGRYGRAALESLKSDAGFMKDPKRARDLLMALDGEQHLQEQVSEKVLADNVLIAPGSGKPDATFWSALIQDRYNVMTCIEKDACVLVEQDLNSDGQAERILFAFNDDRVIVYGFDSARKEWDALDMSLLPRQITKEKLLTAAKDGKLGTRPKAWRDLVVDGERLDVNLNE